MFNVMVVAKKSLPISLIDRRRLWFYGSFCDSARLGG